MTAAAAEAGLRICLRTVYRSTIHTRRILLSGLARPALWPLCSFTETTSTAYPHVPRARAQTVRSSCTGPCATPNADPVASTQSPPDGDRRSSSRSTAAAAGPTSTSGGGTGIGNSKRPRPVSKGSPVGGAAPPPAAAMGAPPENRQLFSNDVAAGGGTVVGGGGGGSGGGGAHPAKRGKGAATSSPTVNRGRADIAATPAIAAGAAAAAALAAGEVSYSTPSRTMRGGAAAAATPATAGARARALPDDAQDKDAELAKLRDVVRQHHPHLDLAEGGAECTSHCLPVVYVAPQTICPYRTTGTLCGG